MIYKNIMSLKTIIFCLVYFLVKFNITVNSLVDIKDILKFLSLNEKFKEHKESMQNYIQKFCIL